MHDIDPFDFPNSPLVKHKEFNDSDSKYESLEYFGRVVNIMMLVGCS